MNMPRGTQHKRDWKETTLQVVIDAKRLYCNSKRLLRRMDHFVNSLMEEINGTDNQRKSAA